MPDEKGVQPEGIGPNMTKWTPRKWIDTKKKLLYQVKFFKPDPVAVGQSEL